MNYPCLLPLLAQVFRSLSCLLLFKTQKECVGDVQETPHLLLTLELLRQSCNKIRQ